MANALGTLFGDIATAIREKTGDTATMKPAEFPEKIAAIAGGGGGSLPSGVYWEQVSPFAPYSYANYYFTYNEELFVNVKTSSSSDSYVIYRYDGDKYTAVSNTLTIMYGYNNPFVYKGKLHFLDTIGHYTYDGSTLTRLNNHSTEGGTRVSTLIWNGILYVYGKGALWKWDEVSDTWTDSGITADGRYKTGAIFIHNNKLYRLDSNKLYEYIDGSAVEVKTFDVYYASGYMVYRNGCIFFCSGSSTYNIFKYDIDNDLLTNLRITPATGVNGYLYCHNGTVRLAGGSNTWRNNLIMHEVTE